MTSRLLTFLCCCLLICGPTLSHAQPESDPAITPPRLSLIDGAVSFWRPGAEDWTPARLNTPLTAGDELYADSPAACELQVGPQAYIRAGEATELGVSTIEPDFLQVSLTSGEGAVDVRELPPSYTIEIDTPQGAFTVERPGYYRVNVEQELTTFIARRGGEAIASVEGQQPVMVHTDEELVLANTQSPELAAAPDFDRWDRWNYSRTDSLLNVRSARYVPPGVYGLHELDHYGRWRTTEEYGSVWMPDDVPSGWAPYTTGRWIWDPEYEWTWVDNASWGWAPFHYGRWVSIDDAWAWAPGPPVATPAYAPALVGFFESGPQVGWVPLSWGEPVVPWWGPRDFRDRPWWGGWRGPRIVNNEIINERTEINVNQIVYRNARVTNAIVAAPAEEFGSGRAHFVRLSAAEARPVHSPERVLPARPTPVSLVPGTGHAPSPPPQVHNRPVVATRPPRAPARVLSEMTKQTAVPPPPQPRLVSRPSPAQLSTLAHPSAKTEQERPSSSLPPRFGAPSRQQVPNRSANLPSSESARPTPPEQHGVTRTPPPPPSHTPPERGERGPVERSERGPVPPHGITRATPPPIEPRGPEHRLPEETFRHQPPPPPTERGPVPPHGITRTTPPPVEPRSVPHRPAEEGVRRQPPPPPSHTPPPPTERGARSSVPPHGITRATPPPAEPRGTEHRPPEETFRHQPPPPAHTPPPAERNGRGPVPPRSLTRATPPPVEPRGAPHQPPVETFRHQPPPPAHTPPPRPQERSARVVPQRDITAGARLRQEQRAEVHQPPRQYAVPRAPVPQPQARASAAPQPRPPSAKGAPPAVQHQEHAARTPEKLQALR